MIDINKKEMDISFSNKRLMNHKKQLLEGINNNADELIRIMKNYLGIFRKFNKDFAKAEINNLNISDIVSFNFLVYEVKLTLNLLDMESTLNRDYYLKVNDLAITLLKELSTFKHYILNYFADVINDFNPLDLADTTTPIFSKLVNTGVL